MKYLSKGEKKMLNPSIQIELQFEKVRHAVIEHINNYNRELENLVEEVLKEKLTSVNFEILVQNNIQMAIEKSVYDYFSIGDGYANVRSVVYDALDNRMSNYKNKTNDTSVDSTNS
jgi:hypothetical protein